MLTTDYLIVGQGLSGSILALTLLRAGKTVHVIDFPQLSCSSRVAAGIYNPFTFKRMVNSWEAEEVAPFATAFYQQLEKELDITFHYSRAIWKVLADASERKLWEQASTKRPGLFADKNIVEDPLPGVLRAPYGVGIVPGSGNIITSTLLTAVRNLLRSKNALTETIFDYNQLTINAGSVTYAGNITARQFVNCQGHLSMQTDLFSFLPLGTMKGEVLHLHIPQLQVDAIINRGAYLMPVGDGRFVCGSTYERDIDNEDVTELARAEMLGKLSKFLLADIHVERQFAGVRPVVRDRRPLLGRHPEYPELAVFNGMGSKAVMLAPWLAVQLIEHLENDTPLHPEVNLKRFLKKR